MHKFGSQRRPAIHPTGPCQLVWQVKKFSPSVPLLLAAELIHLPGKRAGVLMVIKAPSYWPLN